MARRKLKADLQECVCEQLADFYEEDLKPSDLLAVKLVQRDVVVIGPDGRKFRLQHAVEEKPVKQEMEKVS